MENFFQTQLHNLILTDPLDGGNSIHIDASIEAVSMPSDPNITDPTGLIIHGSWISLDATQPYVPMLVGGEVGGAYTAGKYEAYNGDITE